MPKRFRIGAMGVGCCALAVLGAAAQAEEQLGRYTMTPADGGFVRLDRETGVMSFCSGKENDWSCKPMPDGQKELQGRIDQLERENNALRDEQSQLGAGSGLPGEPPDAGAPPEPPGNLPIPKEDDVDKLFDYVEGMMKKFKERIKRLEKEAQKETPL